jgi:hypothetical protein
MDQVDPSWLMVLSCRPGSKLLAGLLYCCAVTDGLQPIVYRYELAADARAAEGRRQANRLPGPARGEHVAASGQGGRHEEKEAP